MIGHISSNLVQADKTQFSENCEYCNSVVGYRKKNNSLLLRMQKSPKDVSEEKQIECCVFLNANILQS